MPVITCIEDLRLLAKRRVPKMFYEYADSGAWTESTYRANEIDFAPIRLRQRVAVDIDNRSLVSTMVGQPVSMPIALAPVGLTGMQHADGEILAARAAAKAGVPFTLSTMSICSIEDVAENTDAPFWFQLYVMRDRDFITRLIERARAAQCSALVLTLDLQVMGQRHKDIRNGLSAPPKPTLANLMNLATKPRWCLGMLRTKRRTFRNIAGHAKGVDDLSSLSSWTNQQFDPTLDWDDVKWVRDQWKGKLILKGILDAEDVEPAVAVSYTHLEPTVIDALYEASAAGVKIDLIVRGVCALRPGVPGLSQNIAVRSVVGRFLEHSRVFFFHNGGKKDVWLSSADWMDRNLFRRVEIAFPVRDRKLKERVIDEAIDVHLRDNVNAWVMDGDGNYRRKRRRGKPFVSQLALLARLAGA